eukprot:TRINITY_DN7090_c0_g3_i2.p1 TRINITY_DN7090_c0_g3~~TRINITY_DN7090_c0_g3_i2.p1  ORF type:complete len:956 (-),score=372.15 TRINITY_DN7090_c0_g3_i2:59-2896(-)
MATSSKKKPFGEITEKNDLNSAKKQKLEEDSSSKIKAKAADWAPLVDETPKKEENSTSVPLATPASIVRVRRHLFNSPGGSSPPSTPDATPSRSQRSIITSVQREPVKVFLRVRPLNREESNRGDTHCIQYSSETPLTISLRPPKDSIQYRTNGDAEHKYTFTGVMGERSAQTEVFSACAVPVIESFLKGINGLIFSYGITNAGKSYTISGNKPDPGILPRTLDVIFNSINPSSLRPPARKIQRKVGEFEYSSSDYDLSSVSDMESLDDYASRAIETLVLPTNRNSKFTIFISYLEIYNEKVFDLLDEVISAEKRNALKLKEDKSGHLFVKDLREIKAGNSEEAQKILLRGMKNRQVANTLLNQDSSRSHAVITIKLVEVPKDKTREELAANPSLIKYRKLSIIDLAGSERNRRTKTTGAQLKEASNINTSLMTFGRCIETLKYNQMHPNTVRVIPYRDSKLTRLFQDFFIGNGKASMIVNVSPGSSDYDETCQVLKFSAIAKDITTSTRVLDTGRGNPLTKSCKKETLPLADINQMQIMPEPVPLDLGEEEGNMNGINLEALLEAEEARVREEMGNEMAERLVEMEQQFEMRLAKERALNESKYEKKIQMLQRMYDEKSEETPESIEEREESRLMIESLTMDKKKLLKQSSDLGKEIENLKVQIESLQQHEEELKSRLEAQLEAKTKEMEQKCNSLLSQIEEHKERFEEQGEKLREQREENERLKETLSNMLMKATTPIKPKNFDASTPVRSVQSESSYVTPKRSSSPPSSTSPIIVVTPPDSHRDYVVFKPQLDEEQEEEEEEEVKPKRGAKKTTKKVAEKKPVAASKKTESPASKVLKWLKNGKEKEVEPSESPVSSSSSYSSISSISSVEEEEKENSKATQKKRTRKLFTAKETLLEEEEEEEVKPKRGRKVLATIDKNEQTQSTGSKTPVARRLRSRTKV